MRSMLANKLSDLAAEELESLDNRFNHEFVLYIKNRERMAEFAMHAKLDEDEIAEWVGEAALYKYFVAYEAKCSIQEVIRKNNDFMKRAIEAEAANVQAQAKNISQDIRPLKIPQNCDYDVFNMEESSVALSQEVKGELPQVNCIDEFLEISRPAPVPNKRVIEVAEYSDCNTCGLAGCGDDCWAFPGKTKANLDVTDVKFFIKNSLLSSTGEKIPDICSNCGEVGCGLFCNAPAAATNVMSNNHKATESQRQCKTCESIGCDTKCKYIHKAVNLVGCQTCGRQDCTEFCIGPYKGKDGKNRWCKHCEQAGHWDFLCQKKISRAHSKKIEGSMLSM
jgi:hypothetical protein